MLTASCRLIYPNEDFDSYHNLSASNPYPFHEVQVYDPKTGHNHNEFTLLDSGLVALQARLEMIRRAKHSIAVEYFIFSPDISGKLLVHELIDASRRGVSVRILIDKSSTVFQFDEYYAEALKAEGIEVRYYNAAPLYFFSTINFRNHRKLLLVDDREAITGGRNVENDYFDLSEQFNFLDRDVLVQGDIVKTMRLSFDAFFEHEISERPTPPSANSNREREVKNFLASSEQEKQYRQQIAAIAQPLLAKLPQYACPVTTFTSDAPGGSFWSRFRDPYSDDYRFLRKTLFDKAVAVEHRLTAASPYMIHNKKSADLMQRMQDKGVDITLYTNSLASTDASYVAARLYDNVYDWQRSGIKIYLHSGLWAAETPAVSPAVEAATWGMHGKTQVYDSNEIMVGTYNLDNRSNHYNSEMAIFCSGNKELAAAVEDSIMTRAQQGYQIVGDQRAVDADGNEVSVYGAGDPDTRKMRFMWLPSWLFEFLL